MLYCRSGNIVIERWTVKGMPGFNHWMQRYLYQGMEKAGQKKMEIKGLRDTNSQRMKLIMNFAYLHKWRL